MLKPSRIPRCVSGADGEFYGLIGTEAGEGLADDVHGDVVPDAGVHAHDLPAEAEGCRKSVFHIAVISLHLCTAWLTIWLHWPAFRR